MIKETEPFYEAEKTLRLLYPKGLFVTAGRETPNTMTIGWGNLGINWSKPCFTILVAGSRYTHSLIERDGEFTVSVPYRNMTHELAYVGTHSGRDENKYEACGLKTASGIRIQTAHIDCVGMHYECRVIDVLEVGKDRLDPSVYEKRYAKTQDFHTVYFGEIVSSYIQEEE